MFILYEGVRIALLEYSLHRPCFLLVLSSVFVLLLEESLEDGRCTRVKVGVCLDLFDMSGSATREMSELIPRRIVDCRKSVVE